MKFMVVILPIKRGGGCVPRHSELHFAYFSTLLKTLRSFAPRIFLMS